VFLSYCVGLCQTVSETLIQRWPLALVRLHAASWEAGTPCTLPWPRWWPSPCQWRLPSPWCKGSPLCWGSGTGGTWACWCRRWEPCDRTCTWPCFHPACRSTPSRRLSPALGQWTVKNVLETGTQHISIDTWTFWVIDGAIRAGKLLYGVAAGLQTGICKWINVGSINVLVST